MLGRLFRQSKALPLRKKIHPLLLKIRGTIERFAEELDKGDQPPEDALPAVYQDQTEELQALAKAMPETPEEEKYLDDRYQELVSDIERTRLQYFDSVFGTNTYFHELDSFQERVFIDTILERFALKYYGKRTRVPIKLTHIADMRALEAKKMLRPLRTDQEVLHRNFDQKLLMVSSPVYDRQGHRHSDPFKYLHPKVTAEREASTLVPQIALETERLQLFLTHKDATIERVSAQFQDFARNNLFHEFIPLLHRGKAYFFSRKLRSFFRVDAALLADPRTKIDSDSSDLARVGQLDLLLNLDDIRGYFFNFKDDFSFGICRYLKHEDIEPSHIHRITVDETGRFASLTLHINSYFLTVVQDLHTKRFLPSFGVSQLAPVFALGPGKLYQLFPSVKMLDFDSSEFVAPRLQQLQIPSLIRYIKDNESNLLDNDGWRGRPLHGDDRMLGCVFVDMKFRQDCFWATALRREDGLNEEDFSQMILQVRDSADAQARAKLFRETLRPAVYRLGLDEQVLEVQKEVHAVGPWGEWRRGETLDAGTITDLTEVSGGVVLLTQHPDGSQKLYRTPQ